MKYSIEKFQIKITIEDKTQSDFYQLKQKVLQSIFRDERPDILLRYQNGIQQIINDRAKRTGIKFGLTAYIADYEERQGSFEIIFLLIIESIVVYTHLRHFAEIIKEDIITLFGHDRLFTIHSEIRDIPNPNVEEQLKQNTKNKFTISSLLIIIVCLTVSVLFFIFKLTGEKDTTKPTEFIIKTEKGQPIIKALDNIIIYKDTFELKTVDTTASH